LSTSLRIDSSGLRDEEGAVAIGFAVEVLGAELDEASAEVLTAAECVVVRVIVDVLLLMLLLEVVCEVETTADVVALVDEVEAAVVRMLVVVIVEASASSVSAGSGNSSCLLTSRALLRAGYSSVISDGVVVGGRITGCIAVGERLVVEEEVVVVDSAGLKAEGWDGAGGGEGACPAL